MKKWFVAFILFFFLLLVSSLLWYTQASTSSGIYPEKHTGLVGLPFDGTSSLEYELPVRWIKSHPWEKEPIIEDLLLYDQTGIQIAKITGQYQIDSHDHNWYERNVGGYIQLYLQGEMTADSSRHSVIWNYESLPTSFQPSKLTMTYGGKQATFSLKDQLRIVPIPTDDFLPYENDILGVQGIMFFNELDNTQQQPNGLLVTLSHHENVILEDLLFWLPGMTDDYFEKEASYIFDITADEFSNSTELFSGEPLLFPLELSGHTTTVLYFPFTEAIKEQNSDSNTRFIPYITYSTSKGERYLTGGGGMVGPLNREKQWKDLFILPNQKQ
ncbi:hypothetical protein [Bacillus alkalicellulosilyticus]|uniref:hypothetical protein n=1 Tax=Alkalihalobacterium alkalicellulosilyticum TaxID=1912214 RepID=UPI0009963F05|nr:hypothetical protein [Bacillus alkalicellulosilyticus]